MTYMWDSVLHTKEAHGRPSLTRMSLNPFGMSSERHVDSDAIRPSFYFCPSDDEDNESVIDTTANSRHSSHRKKKADCHVVDASGKSALPSKECNMSASYPPPAEPTSQTADALQSWIRQWLSAQQQHSPAPKDDEQSIWCADHMNHCSNNCHFQ